MSFNLVLIDEQNNVKIIRRIKPKSCQNKSGFPCRPPAQMSKYVTSTHVYMSLSLKWVQITFNSEVISTTNAVHITGDEISSCLR